MGPRLLHRPSERWNGFLRVVVVTRRSSALRTNPSGRLGDGFVILWTPTEQPDGGDPKRANPLLDAHAARHRAPRSPNRQSVHDDVSRGRPIVSNVIIRA